MATEGQEELLPVEPAQGASFATLISIDGRVLRLDASPDGGLTVTIEKNKPLVLDRFQAAAFRAAVAATGAA